jgi:hypothetical protein
VRILFVAAAILSAVCADAFGQAYRWVDQDGRVHYTQTPPPPDAKGVQRKSFRHGPVGTVDLPYATQLAAKNFPVTLYTQPDCGAPCDQARALLVKRAVPFREVSVVTQKDADEMKRLSGKSDLPLLRRHPDANRISGSSDEQPPRFSRLSVLCTSRADRNAAKDGSRTGSGTAGRGY